MARKTHYSMAVTPDADESVSQLAEMSGYSKRETLERICRWVGGQPERVQRAVLGMLGSDRDAILIDVLREMTRDKQNVPLITLDERGQRPVDTGKAGSSGKMQRSSGA